VKLPLLPSLDLELVLCGGACWWSTPETARTSEKRQPSPLPCAGSRAETPAWRDHKVAWHSLAYVSSNAFAPSFWL
jgi:hypothetical protein